MVLFLAFSATSWATDPITMHNLLNKQRQADGIPTVTYDPAMTDGCNKHNRYNQLNPGTAHGEEPGRPGYTPEGDGGYAGEVLFPGVTDRWSETENPWTNYPLHFANVMNPSNVSMGGAESFNQSCYRVSPSWNNPRTWPTPTFYSSPSNGRTGVGLTTNATGESPYAPQDKVGLGGQDTGYNQVVWLKGVSNPTISAVSMADSSGRQVEARQVDDRFVIPVQPLAGYTTYRTTVVWKTSDGQTIPTSFAFETRGRENGLDFTLKKGKGSLEGVMITEGGSPVATLTRAGGRPQPLALKRDTRNRETTWLAKASNLAPGSYTLCGRSGGRATGFEMVTQCESATVSAYTKLGLSKRLGRGRKAKLSVSGLALGRKAVVRMTRYRRTFTPGFGPWLKKVSKTRKKTIRLSKKTMRLKVPRAGKRGRVKVSVALKSYRSKGVRVSGSNASRTYR